MLRLDSPPSSQRYHRVLKVEKYCQEECCVWCTVAVLPASFAIFYFYTVYGLVQINTWNRQPGYHESRHTNATDSTGSLGFLGSYCTVVNTNVDLNDYILKYRTYRNKHFACIVRALTPSKRNTKPKFTQRKYKYEATHTLTGMEAQTRIHKCQSQLAISLWTGGTLPPHHLRVLFITVWQHVSSSLHHYATLHWYSPTVQQAGTQHNHAKIWQ